MSRYNLWHDNSACPWQEDGTFRLMCLLLYNNYMSRTRICHVKSYGKTISRMSGTRRWDVFRYFLSLEWHLQFHDMNMACCTIWHENAHVPGTSRRHVLICFSCTGTTLAIQGSRSGQKLILLHRRSGTLLAIQGLVNGAFISYSFGFHFFGTKINFGNGMTRKNIP